VTTNYFSRDRIAGYGGKLVKARYHRDGKLVTGAGVSASIDAGIFLAREIAGEAAARTLQLGVEYYPDSPFADTRTPDDAPEAAKAMVKAFEASSERFLASRTAPFA
jgi:transcriptional regulator GlxA family with amidase domain